MAARRGGNGTVGVKLRIRGEMTWASRWRGSAGLDTGRTQCGWTLSVADCFGRGISIRFCALWHVHWIAHRTRYFRWGELHGKVTDDIAAKPCPRLSTTNALLPTCIRPFRTAGR